MQAASSDKTMLDVLRRNGAVTIAALVAEMGVTATAVRQRLQRLMANGLIQRQAESKGRGRPNHRYSLTEKGERSAGGEFCRHGGGVWGGEKRRGEPGISCGVF